MVQNILAPTLLVAAAVVFSAERAAAANPLSLPAGSYSGGLPPTIASPGNLSHSVVLPGPGVSQHYDYGHYYFRNSSDYDYYLYHGRYPNENRIYTGGSSSQPLFSGAPTNMPPAYAPPVATQTSSSRAHLTIKVPANAELWLNGIRTTATGLRRYFQTPALERGYRYTYKVRAQWQHDGRLVTEEQTVRVSPGANLGLEFPMKGEPSVATRAAEEH